MKLFKKHLCGNLLSTTICLLAMLLHSQIAFSQTYSVYVGQEYTLPEPTAPAGYVDHVGYGECTNKKDCITVNGLKVYVYKYFSGTATIEVQYSYTYTINGKRQVNTGTAYYSVACKTTSVKMNKSELTMNVGDEYELKYSTTPSGLRPYVNWKTTDPNICQIWSPDYSSKENIEWRESIIVEAVAEGSCTIKLQSNTGETSPVCKVTVIDLRWVNADVPSGSVVKGTKVTLTSKKSGATIYYTTDGSEPTKKSTKYTSPITINESLTLKAKAFLGNEESLTTVREYEVVAHADGEIFTYKSLEGVDIKMKAYSDGSSILLQVGTGEEGTTAIDKNYTGHITIPDYVDGMSVHHIAEYAFDGCKLSSVSNAKKVASYAFRNCSNLKEIIFPFTALVMSKSFENCKSLRTITFYSISFSTSISYFNKNASNVFDGCTGIRRIYCKRNCDKIKDDVFPENVYKEATIYTNKDYVSSYKSKAGWKKFSSIKNESVLLDNQVQLSSSLVGEFKVPKGTKIKLSTTNVEDANIYYTLDGTNPSNNDTKYESDGIEISKPCVLKCIAYKSGYDDSDILISGVYDIREDIAPAQKDVKQISASQYHTMFVLTDGTLWACGENKYGELGDGSTTDRNLPKKILNDVEYVSSGLTHTLIVKSDGSLWACGQNSDYQLGDGSKNTMHTPVKIMDDVACVSAGSYYSLILKKDGTLWGCGDNDNGKLGNGSEETITSPQKIMNNVASISAGWYHSLIVKNDGSLWSCGYNNCGQLGDGTKTNRSKPQKIMDNVKSASAGNYTSFIITNDGTLWACGSNGDGELGDGTNENRKSPVKIMEDVSSVSAKYDHSLIIKNDGTLWACGNNEYGQLGDGTTINRNTPIKIMDGVSLCSSGRTHSLIVKSDKSLWVYGKNTDGQLGDGTEWGSATPFMIVGSSSPSDIIVPTTSKIHDNKTIYSLSGQKLLEPRKGINIIGGKKIIIK